MPAFKRDLFIFNGNCMVFNVKACKDADELRYYIEFGGGCVESSNDEGPYTITLLNSELDAAVAEWAKDAFNSNFILKCGLENKILSLKKFWLKKSSRFNNNFDPNEVLQQKITWEGALQEYSVNQHKRDVQLVSSSPCLIAIDKRYPVIALKRCDNIVPNCRLPSEDKKEDDIISVDVVDEIDPLISKRVSKRNEFTDREREQMVEYVVINNCYGQFKQQEMWQKMKKKFPRHTWQSLKEHFRKKIIPSISKFNLTSEVVNKFRKGWNVPAPLDSDISDSETDSKPLTYRKQAFLKIKKDCEVSSDSSGPVFCRRRGRVRRQVSSEADEEETIQLSSSESDSGGLPDESDEEESSNLEKNTISWEWVEDNVPVNPVGGITESNSRTNTEENSEPAICDLDITSEEDKSIESGEEKGNEGNASFETLKHKTVKDNVPGNSEDRITESNSRTNTEENSVPAICILDITSEEDKLIKSGEENGTEGNASLDTLKPQTAQKNLLSKEKAQQKLILPVWPSNFEPEPLLFVEETDQEQEGATENHNSDEAIWFVRESESEEEVSTNVSANDMPSDWSEDGLHRQGAADKSHIGLKPPHGVTPLVSTPRTTDADVSCPSPVRASLSSSGIVSMLASPQAENTNDSAESFSLLYRPETPSSLHERSEAISTGRESKDFCVQWDLGDPDMEDACIQTDFVVVVPIPVNSSPKTPKAPPVSNAAGSSPSYFTRGSKLVTAKQDHSESPSKCTFSSKSSQSSEDVILPAPIPSSCLLKEVEIYNAEGDKDASRSKSKRRRSVDVHQSPDVSLDLNKKVKVQLQVQTHSSSSSSDHDHSLVDVGISPGIVDQSSPAPASSSRKTWNGRLEEVEQSPGASSKHTEKSSRKAPTTGSPNSSWSDMSLDGSSIRTRSRIRQEKRQTRSVVNRSR